MSFNRYEIHPLALLLPALLLAGTFIQPQKASAQTVLFVYNAGENDESARDDGSIRDEDHLYLTILEDQLGYAVELIDQNDVSPADTAGVDLIFISESVGSGTVVTNLIGPTTGDGVYGNFDKPMITAEEFVMDDMLWIKSAPVPPYGIDYAWGFAESETVNILPGNHALLGGVRSGPIDVYDAPPANEPSNQVGYAVPNGEGQILAALPGTAQFGGEEVGRRFDEDMRASLFVFEEGDMIHDTDTLEVVAAARRVAFFAHTRGSENLNETGQALFANAVAWALGDEANLREITVDPYRVLVIFNGALNDEQDPGDTGGLDNEDFEYLTIIEDSLGYEAVVVDQNDVSPADTADVDMIFISETVGSGTVATNFINAMTGGAQYGNVAKPIINNEIFLLDDMHWMKTGEDYQTDVHFGFADAELIDILDTHVPDPRNTDHPISRGLALGEVTPYDNPPAGEESNQIGYSVPQDTAVIVAALGSDATFGGDPLQDIEETRATIFTYGIGDTLIASDTLDLVAKDRRAQFFAHTRGGDNLNVVGRALFMNTVLWASGRDSETITIDATGVATEPGSELPATFSIESVYPNPFNPSATASLKVKEAGPYELKIYDVLGRLVQRHEMTMAPGEHQVSLEMLNHASGTYLIQFVQTQTGKIATTRAVLMK